MLVEVEKKELALAPKYQTMLENIAEKFPAIEKATSNFKKTQSQFMDNMLTVSHPTELRNARQILAEIEKSRMALDEAYFGIEKKKITIKVRQRFIDYSEVNPTDEFELELAKVEIAELESQIKNSMGYVEGAIRKINAYMNQYNAILKSVGKEEFTEQDFEEDEERYHIMKMFEQALCAARAHGGIMDEGNQIYAHQIGINGTMAQTEIERYLNVEVDLISKGLEPAHEMTVKWLKAMYEKYKGSAKKYAQLKGMTDIIDMKSLNSAKEE